MSQLRPTLALHAIQFLAADDMAAVDTLIRRRLASDVVLVNQVAEHIVAGGGKRLRPMLLLLAARAGAFECRCAPARGGNRVHPYLHPAPR